jgi:RecB family exonuclease
VASDPLPWPAVDVALTEPFRHPQAPALVVCRHPSTEPEAVAGELLAARDQGLPWSDMAVLVRRPYVHGRRMARALGRHGIPVATSAWFGARAHDPAVVAILDLLRWTTRPDDRAVPERLLASPLSGLGAEGLVALRHELAALAGTATPSELGFLIWERGLGHLAAGDRRDDVALDAVVAFLDRLERLTDDTPEWRLPDLLATVDEGGLEPDCWRISVAAAGDSDTVTITSVTAAAGREWHTVVLTGCVEGELPKISGRAPLFDPAVLDGEAPPSPAERRARSLADERRVFALACSRATGRLIGTAAPQPGVLLSRFVEAWTERPGRPVAFAGPAPVRLQPTESAVAVFPDGRLTLSASQLDTYDDCPLRYAYQYGLRARDEGGAPAALGSLVHEVLCEFLRPDRPAEAPLRSKEELLALAAERWTDDIARYRPQIEECRRDYFRMLEDWWAAEGEGPLAPEVLAVERRFDVEVGDLRLVGAIDRVDRAADGVGIRIVDYKTGRREPRADAMPDDLQLAIYHLAATRDPELAELGPPSELRLLYLRSMHAYEQPVVAGHAQATIARISEAADAIRSEGFEPSVDASCRLCSFHRLCPLQAEGREVGAE